MKRSFTGPVWLLLIFGLFQLLMVWQLLQAVTGHYPTAVGSPLRQAGFIASILMWPLILWAEALVYWLIRRRNRAQLLSWTHGVILCFAFFLNGIIYLLLILHSPVAVVMFMKGGRNVQVVVFWALVLLAHAAFVQVLILAFRKPELVKRQGGGAENILDDVIL